MMSKMMFNSEVELGKFLGSVDIISEAYGAISETNFTYELHTTRSGIDVLAFNSCVDFTFLFLEGDFIDLVSSEKLQVLDFIPTKVNPSFSINQLASVELFQDLGGVELKELEDKHINIPLIITGSGLNGYLAITSALRLHHAIDEEESNGSMKTKRPICITFGCPLVGDEAFQKAIAERPEWRSSFLNVVAKNDIIASFFSSNSPYKPLGTYLFCTESGGHAAFEDQDSILLVLDAMKSSGNLQVYDYKNALSSIRRNILYHGVSELDEFNLNPLRAGIKLQLRELSVLDDISNDQIGRMEEKQIKLTRSKKKAYEPTKKLNDMKIKLTYMEWYMKKTKPKGGYYDSYKNAKTKDEIKSQQEILKCQRFLNKYWEDIVEENNRMPQKEGAKMRKRWLYGGTNYRRIVEPLDIAEYYKNGQRDYIKNRSNHYKLLEKWSDEDKKLDLKSSEEKRNKAASLTEDSCFWAHVEESLISLTELLNGGSGDIEKELEKFQAYVMCEIKKYALSPDVFEEGSSLMEWWKKYKAYKQTSGTAYASEFAQYMNKKSYDSYNK